MTEITADLHLPSPTQATEWDRDTLMKARWLVGCQDSGWWDGGGTRRLPEVPEEKAGLGVTPLGRVASEAGPLVKETCLVGRFVL